MLRSLCFVLLATVASAGDVVEEITSEAAFKKVLADNIAVAVDFYSQTCGPCIMMAPIYKEVRRSRATSRIHKSPSHEPGSHLHRRTSRR